MADTIAHAVFGLLFETSTDAAFIVDRATGRIVSANVRAADLLACDIDLLVGARLSDLVLEDRAIDLAGHYEEVAFRRQDDYPVYVELQVALVDSAKHGPLTAYMARDTSERRNLERELVAKHSALFAAYAQLNETKLELEQRNQEIAVLAWRVATGELVAGIAHHLNNPVGALASTTRRLGTLVQRLPDEQRTPLARLLTRVEQIARRIESNVAAIEQASRTDRTADRTEFPPELRAVVETFAQRLEAIPTKERT